jgi:DNA polymerase-3 subunit epsilon
MKFIAVDIETANPDLSSICQIGVVSFQDFSLLTKWKSLINPEDDFDPWNIAIHGITEDHVKEAPTLPLIFNQLQRILDKQVVVCHTSFDRVALARATEKYRLPQIDCLWLDSAKVVRRAWPQFAKSGYGLKSITMALNISFKHHDAEEDARAAGEVMLCAIAETGRSLEDWFVRIKQPIAIADSRIAREGNPDGPLAGELVVFTGALSISRREAAELAAKVGCSVAQSINQSTTLLVVGDQDIRRLAGHEKSSKRRKAEELIAKGQPIRIIGEGDFLRLVNLEETT